MAKKKKEKDIKQSTNDMFEKLQNHNRNTCVNKPEKVSEIKKRFKSSHEGAVEGTKGGKKGANVVEKEKARAKPEKKAVPKADVAREDPVLSLPMENDGEAALPAPPPLRIVLSPIDPNTDADTSQTVPKESQEPQEPQEPQESKEHEMQETREPQDAESSQEGTENESESNEDRSQRSADAAVAAAKDTDPEHSEDDFNDEEDEVFVRYEKNKKKNKKAEKDVESGEESVKTPNAIPQRLRKTRRSSTKMDDILFFAQDLETEIQGANNGPVSLHNKASSGKRFAADFTPEQKEHLRIGTDKFNTKVSKGLEYLIANGVIKEDAHSIAELLYHHEGLSKTRIGNYLATNNDFNAKVRSEFLSMCDFRNLVFDDALRLFLSHFRLPGEAQQIDRMMEGFAGAYCDANEDSLFATKDAAYVLAFALIMLNTDHHNPNVVKKMTKEEFLKSCKGINAGEDLPNEFMEYIYDRIIENEIKMEVEHSDFAHPDIQGWLVKQGGQIKSWRKRYTIIHGHMLHYFKDESCKTPCGMIPLENLAVKTDNLGKRDNLFALYNPNEGHVKSARFKDGQAIEGQHDNFIFQAKTSESKAEWVETIQNCMTNNPYYGILLEAKRRTMTPESKKK